MLRTVPFVPIHLFVCSFPTNSGWYLVSLDSLPAVYLLEQLTRWASGFRSDFGLCEPIPQGSRLNRKPLMLRFQESAFL